MPLGFDPATAAQPALRQALTAGLEAFAGLGPAATRQGTLLLAFPFSFLCLLLVRFPVFESERASSLQQVPMLHNGDGNQPALRQHSGSDDRRAPGGLRAPPSGVLD